MRRIPMIAGLVGSVSGIIVAIAYYLRGCGPSCDGINEAVFALSIVLILVMSVLGLLAAALSVRRPWIAAVLMLVSGLFGVITVSWGATIAMVPVVLLLGAAILSFFLPRTRLWETSGK